MNNSSSYDWLADDYDLVNELMFGQKAPIGSDPISGSKIYEGDATRLCCMIDSDDQLLFEDSPIGDDPLTGKAIYEGDKTVIACQIDDWKPWIPSWIDDIEF